MTIVNERIRIGDNSENIFTLQVRDTNSHDLPDVDADDSDGGDGFSVEQEDGTVVKIVNNLDVAMDLTLEATNYDDGSFTEPYTADSETSLAAGAVTVLGENVSAPYDFYRITVTTNGTTAPASGEVKAVYLTEERQ